VTPTSMESDQTLLGEQRALARLTPPPGVLSATASGLSAAVIWKAPQSVEASNERGSAPVPILAPPSVACPLTFAIGQVSHLLTMQL
jgi:hypothetical protein